MRIVYMGTPEFAVAPLVALKEAGHEIVMVLSQPDRQRDRGKKLQPTKVAEKARELGLPLYQPEQIKDNAELTERLREITPDLAVVVAYGKLLPSEWLEIPAFGCINIHGSLLPEYRGAAPIQHAILAGKDETGVTLMYLSEGMDEGDMIRKRSTPIDRKTAGELFVELSGMGAELLVETLPFIEAGNAERIKQDHSLATYAPLLKKQDGLVDFHKKATDIERQIRAMNPWPGAYTYFNGEPVKLLSAGIVAEDGGEKAVAGRVRAVGGDFIDIETREDTLRIYKIQMPGKRAMEISDFLKGNQIDIGTILG